MTQWQSFSLDEQVQRTGLVVEKFCKVEILIDLIISEFIEPQDDARDFVRSYLLDNSIVSFSSKVKLLQAIDRAKNTSHINRDKFHRLLSIRNAFAHNNVGGSIEVEFREPQTIDTYFFIESMKGNGAKQRTRRDDAFGEFHKLIDTVDSQLRGLLASVRSR